MLLLLKIGEAKSRSGAVRQLGACRHSVADWLEPCEEGGLEGIQEIGEFFGLPDESKRAVLQQFYNNGASIRSIGAPSCAPSVLAFLN